MNKRGQLTLFIIIAIVIVATVVLLILFQQGFLRAGLPKSEITRVKAYLTDCFKLKTQDGILFIGKQAGYYSFDNVESIKFLDQETAYYWKDNQILIPNTDRVEEELNEYLNANLNECLIATELVDYEINIESCIISSTISDLIAIEFNCPISVKKGTVTSRLRSFSIIVDAPVLKLLNVSNQVVSEYGKEPGWLCVKCLNEIATQNNVTIKAVPVTKEVAEPEHIWFLITDKDIKIQDQNITWRFVAEL